jgi:putative transposase
MITFIDDNKARWGVEPICAQLPIAPSTYYAFKKRPASARATRDEELKPKIMRVYEQNYEVYGADKIWAQMNRDQVKVARCTVERLMRDLEIQGATRGKSVRTTLPGDSALELPDLVKRKFYAPAPNRLWVSDLTYVRTHGGFRYVAFVIDVYARTIVGWRVSSSLKTAIALDALEQAIWARRCGPLELAELIHHSDRGVQYLAIRYTERVAAAGGVISVGSRGDSYDNALAESVIGLYKTELVHNLGPWTGAEDLEFATMAWVDWWNNRRLLEPIGMIPPAEAEANYYSQNVPTAVVGIV